MKPNQKPAISRCAKRVYVNGQTSLVKGFPPHIGDAVGATLAFIEPSISSIVLTKGQIIGKALKMAEKKQNKAVLVSVVILAVLVAAVIIWIVINKQPEGLVGLGQDSGWTVINKQREGSVDSEQDSGIEAPVEHFEPQVDIQDSEPKLADIIAAARRWGPEYKSWYGRPAPDFTLTDLAGKQHKLSDYRGKDVMLVFWATWCGPCISEIPHLVALRNIVSEDDLAILAISNEKPKLVRSFVAGRKLNYTILTDPGLMTAPYNRVRSIPSSFFITPEGNIKLGTVGTLTLGEIKAILRAK